MQTDEPAPRPFLVRSAKDLGLAVKHYRTQAGLSQAELASRAGVHRTYLSGLEGGRATEALDRVVTLLRELGLRIVVAPGDP